MHGCNDRFSPEARRERRINKHSARHCKDFANPALRNTILMGGANTGVFTLDVGFGQESIDKLGEYLRGLDDWEFTCVYVLSTAVKSLLLARSVLEGKVSIQEGKWWQGFLSERYAAPTDRQTD